MERRVGVWRSLAWSDVQRSPAVAFHAESGLLSWAAIVAPAEGCDLEALTVADVRTEARLEIGSARAC
jgi:hypothetical protein